MATKIRSPEEIMGIKPQPIGLPGLNNNNNANGEPEEGEEPDIH